MLDLLDHPAVQAAVVPGIVATITAAALHKIWPKLSALALLFAFISTSLLITDISLHPLTSTKKIILLTLLSAVLGAVLLYVSNTLSEKRHYIHFGLISSAGIAACSWLLWPVLARLPLWDAILTLTPLAVFCIYSLTISTHNRIAYQERISAGIIFAGVTSISAMLGASALLGQLSASLSAGAGAILFTGFFLKRRHENDHIFSATLFLSVSLIAVAANIYAQLPWYILPVLAAIPTLFLIPINEKIAGWKRSGIYIGLALLPSSLAIYLTMKATTDTMGGY